MKILHGCGRLLSFGLAAAAVFSAGAAHAVTCTVGTGAGKKASIAAALTDTTCNPILIDETNNTLREVVNITRNVTLRGRGPGSAAAGNAQGARTLIRSPGATQRAAAAVGGVSFGIRVASGVTATIEDLTVDGAADAACTETYYGILATGANLTLRRVYVSNVRTAFYTTTCTAPQAAILGGGTGGSLTVSQGTIRSFQNTGIIIDGGTGTVSDTHIYGREDANLPTAIGIAQTGVLVRNGGTATLTKNLILTLVGSGASCGQGTGVMASGAAALTVQRNTIAYVDRAVVLLNSTGLQNINDNRIIGAYLPMGVAGLIGVQSQGNTGGVRVQNNGIGTMAVNACLTGSGRGIWVSGEAGTQVTGNRIIDAGDLGIFIQSGATGAVVNNNQLVRSGGVADIQISGTGTYTGNRCMRPKPVTNGICAQTPYVASAEELM